MHSAYRNSVPRGIIQNLPANLRRDSGVHVVGGADFGDGELNKGDVQKVADDQKFRALAFYLKDRVPGRVSVSGYRFYSEEYFHGRCESAGLNSRQPRRGTVRGKGGDRAVEVGQRKQAACAVV